MSSKPLEGRRVLVTGGTGSLGKLLVHRLLSGEMGEPERVIVFSRDEAKQHQMRLDYLHRTAATDEIIFRNFQQKLEFWIGDIRDFESVSSVLRAADVVFNAAAMKQVPTCEYFPYEAVQTNIAGAENIVRAIQHHQLDIETVVGISTDKACKPVNVMGMSKALQERVFVQANMRRPETRFVCVRYGNVLASRGSVIPLFRDQIRNGGPVTLTTKEMTRFLLSLDQAVDTVFEAVRQAQPGETIVPATPSARVEDVARAMIEDRDIEVLVTGIRPGEKVHEVLISEEEVHRTIRRGDWFAIAPLLPEIAEPPATPALEEEYSSANHLLSQEAIRDLLESHGLLVDTVESRSSELSR